MARLIDDSRILDITMRQHDARYDSLSDDFSDDFFDVGALRYDEELDAYNVPDIDYCLNQAQDFANGAGDFASAEETPDYISCQIDYTITDR